MRRLNLTSWNTSNPYLLEKKRYIGPDFYCDVCNILVLENSGNLKDTEIIVLDQEEYNVLGNENWKKIEIKILIDNYSPSSFLSIAPFPEEDVKALSKKCAILLLKELSNIKIKENPPDYIDIFVSWDGIYQIRNKDFNGEVDVIIRYHAVQWTGDYSSGFKKNETWA